MPRIVIQHGDDSRVVELAGERPVTIGRAKSSSVVLDDASVSRLHAIVSSTLDGKWQIADRDSANGLKINGQPVKESVLRANDEIAIGVYRLRYEDSAERRMMTYGTTQLPKRVAQEMAKPSSYRGTALRVEALGAGAGPGTGGLAREKENEKRLMVLAGRVSEALGEITSLETLTQRTLDFALEIGGAERGFVMLLDAESRERGDFGKGKYNFEPATIRYRKPGSSAPGETLPQLTISRSIIRQVMQACLPMLISDSSADPRFSASQSIVGAGIQSAMCAPLGIGNSIRGLLYVDNLSKRGMFAVDDLNAFAVIAVQAGRALDRVRGKEAPEPART